MPASQLDSQQIASLLTQLPGWTRTGDAIEATYSMPTFPVAIELVRLVADAAEVANHHPDIDIRWRRIRFVLTTHDSGGITALDADLARTIADMAQSLGWQHP